MRLRVESSGPRNQPSFSMRRTPPGLASRAQRQRSVGPPRACQASPSHARLPRPSARQRGNQHTNPYTPSARRDRRDAHVRIGDRPARLAVGDVIPDENAVPAAALSPACEVHEQTRIPVLADVGQSDRAARTRHLPSAGEVRDFDVVPFAYLTHNPGRDAHRHDSRGKVARDDGPRPNHRVLPDANPRADDDTATQPHVVRDLDRLPVLPANASRLRIHRITAAHA